jgi:TonB-dependent starch-binding outer membrane protein SusC
MEMCPLLFLWYRKPVPNRNSLLVMKLLLLFLFVFTFQVCAGSYAQTIRLSVKDVSLVQVFQQIKQQTGYRFVYVRDEINQAKPVSMDVKDASLEEVLDLCFAQQGFTYTIQDRYVIVRRKPVTASATVTNVLLHDVSGYLLDEEGEPAAGVTVQVKGSPVASSSDVQGYFQLKGIEPDAILIFSGVNVEEKSVPVKGAKELTVRLIRKVNKLDEVQVIAYGSTTKRLNTGSVSKISKTEIERQPVANPIAAIQGRAPGVFVTTQNGLPGGNINVLIRGRGSISAGTDPLYVIDGVPFNSTALHNSFTTLTTGITGRISPLNSINPSDIESIEVLKDADATAIYGSRGANGVILITTKQGKAGKAKLDINVYQGVNQLTTFPQLLGVQDFRMLRREAFANDNITATINNAPDLLVWDSTQNTDWARYILGGNASLTNTQVSLSGGTNLLRYLISGNYRREGMILPGEQFYQRGGGHVHLHQQSANKRFGASIKFSYSKDRNESLASSVFSIINQAPNLPIYDAAGAYNWVGVPDVNPASVLLQRARYETENLIGNLQLHYSITDDLLLKGSVGYTSTEMEQIMKYPKSSINPLYGGQSKVYYGDNKTSLVVAEPQVEYKRRFQKHGLQLLGGLTWQHSVRQGSFITGENYNNEGLLEFIGAASTITANNQFTEYKYASVFNRFRYDFDEKYILTLQGRRDGSSRFGNGRRFGHFGSIGAAWIFSSEKFMQFKWLSYGKLRGSIGIAGNDQIPDYQYLSTYRVTGVPYQTVTGLSPARIANADFRWETNRKIEAAIELAFLDNRLFLNSSFYYNLCSNQLVSYPLPYMSGPFGSYLSNLPAEVENKGWEFDLQATPIRKNGISWDFQFNLTIPKNRLLSYPGLENSSYANSYEVGEDIQVYRGLLFTGVDPQTGLPRFEDVNKDGVISTPGDYAVIGRLSPFFYGGFGNDLRIKQFEFSLFFQFSKQFQPGAVPLAGSTSNQFLNALNRWQKPGDITNVPRATTQTSGPFFHYLYSSAGFFNASYLRCKTAGISYRLPDALLKRFGITQMKAYVNGQNLFTIRKDTNLADPETGNSSIAPLRTIAAGVQFTF